MVMTAWGRLGRTTTSMVGPLVVGWGGGGRAACAGPWPQNCAMSVGVKGSLGYVRGYRLQGGIPGGPWVAEKWRFLLGEMQLLLPAFSYVGFSVQAANLTAVVDEKEQSLQEKAEVILQKEQEIFQLKKGEESAPAEPSHLLPPSTPALKWPGPEAAGVTGAPLCPA